MPRLATLTIAFDEPPPVLDGAALVSIDPPIEGSFVWDGDRLLLFQPAFPGWQRGGRYELRVHRAAAALSQDHVHAFTVSGGLEVAYVIPGGGDREVPVEAQILVQFNRSVAARTVLQEGDAPPVLEIDPPIAGRGEWLNTSLYRFTPRERLQPSTQYRVRIPAGLSSAADGVLPSDYSWSFATIQPAVASIEPRDGAKWVEPASPIVVTFNQPMDRASVEARLGFRTEDGSAVASSFVWDEGDRVVTLMPDEPLALGASYDVVAPAGLLGASGGASRARSLSRFTVVEWPILLSTDPADAETAASTGRIRLSYNGPMDIDSFEDRVTISGIDDEDLRVWSWGEPDRIVIAAPLRYSSTYIVRIAAGVRDRGGRELSAGEFSFTTEDPPTPRPGLTLWGGSFLTFSAGGPQVLYYSATSVEAAHFRLYRLTEAEADTLLEGGHSYGLQPRNDPLREWMEPIPEERSADTRLYSTTLGGGSTLPKGDYLLWADIEPLTAGQDSPRDAVMFSVVDRAVITKLANDELLAWILDYDTGEPVVNAGVRTIPAERNAAEYQTSTTDMDGLALFAVAPSGQGLWDYGQHLVRTSARDHHGVASTRWEGAFSPWARSRPHDLGYVFTDRPIYRPGETVQLKGVIRVEDDAAYSLPDSSGEYSLRISHSRLPNALDTSVELTELGSFTTAFTIPDAAPTGRYSVEVYREWAWVGGASFTVAEFRAPEFEVEVATEATDYVAGEAIATEVQASFYFGGTVREGDVTWAARAWQSMIRVEGYEGYSFADFGSHYYYRTRGYYASELRADGEGRTDAAGSARFEAPAALEQDEGTHDFVISATVTDANGRAVANSTTVTVHPAEFYAGIATDSYIAKAGEPETVRLVSVDYLRQIAPNRPVTVRIYQREWVRVPQDGGGHRYELTETEVDVQRATTNGDGEASLAFTPPSAGSYRLVAESRDERERVARSARFLWVSGSEHASWRGSDDNSIELIADRDEYEVGDVAKVLVQAPFSGTTALVTIERGRVLSSEVRTFETNSEVLRIPIEDRYIPNVYVGVVLYRPPTGDDPLPRYRIGYLRIPVSTAPRQLEVRVEPDRDQALPGETVHYEVTVTDAEGRGVQADVAVAVVDAAVLALAGEGTSDAGLGAFWSNRPLGVHTTSSLAVSADHLNEVLSEAGLGDEDAAAPAASPPLPRPDGTSGSDPRLRSDFRHTALWIGQLTTDEQGDASFDLPLPDNTTTWNVRARAVTSETEVGGGESELLVTQPLLARPALPRFLRVGDSVNLRTLVRNGTAVGRAVTVTIEAEGVMLDDAAARTSTIEPGDSAIFEWPARVLEEGTATVRFRAVAGGGYSDAVEISLPVHLDVTPETTAAGGVVEDVPAVEAVYLPDYVITNSGSLELSLQGSLVGALDEELRHFTPYPRDSNVRKASRVVAAVAVKRATPRGLSQTQRARLDTDLATLVAEQKHDGSWGWCSGCESNIWVTAWVLTALSEARDAGHTVPHHGRAWLMIRDHVHREVDIERPADPNQHAYLLYALARASSDLPEASRHLREQAEAMRAIAVEHRADLTSWGRAYLVLGLLATGHEADHELVRQLLNDLTAGAIANANGNHWEDPRIAGCMHNGSVRATAIVLRALIEASPQHPLIEETTRWLTLARSADRWTTSVERAEGMASLGAYAELTGETWGIYDYSVLVNSARVLDGGFDVPAGDYLDSASVALPELPLGEVSRLQFDREAGAEGRLYYGLNLRYVTPAKGIEALNRGFAVSHRYSLLDDPDTPITDASIGDVVRVTLTVVASADRLFTKVEDFLPAGLEPIDPRLAIVSPHLRWQAWYRSYWSPWRQVDLRDDRLVLLAERLPRGVHEYVYYARATTPGDFFVAPAHVEETFFPEVFGRSDSGRFTVTARE